MGEHVSKTLPTRTSDTGEEKSLTPARTGVLARQAWAARVCQRCFARNAAGDTFCKVCGEELPESLADVDADMTRRLVPAAARAQLIVDIGSGYGGTAEFLLEKDVSLVGRSSQADGISPDVDLTDLDPARLVSRRHAFILRRRGGFVLEDLESVNGTYLNGSQRLQPHAQTLLRDGDQVNFGDTRCVFWAEPPAVSTETPAT